MKFKAYNSCCIVPVESPSIVKFILPNCIIFDESTKLWLVDILFPSSSLYDVELNNYIHKDKFGITYSNIVRESSGLFVPLNIKITRRYNLDYDFTFIVLEDNSICAIFTDNSVVSSSSLN